MTSETRALLARERNCVLYGMYLTGEVRFRGWTMQVDKGLLERALGDLRGGARPRRWCGPAPAPEQPDVPRRLWVAGRTQRVVLTVCELGLSVRSCRGQADIRARGQWASPIEVDGGRLRRVVAKLPDGEVQIEFADGRLMLNERSVRAREV